MAKVSRHPPESNVNVLSRSAGDIYRAKDELMMRERASRQIWEEADDNTRAAILLTVRESLLRLLDSPAWIPGAINWNETQRLEVTFVVELSDMDRALRRVIERQGDALREAFEGLLEDLKDGAA